MADKIVLDPCCGTRMFWFDRNDERAIFCDIREKNERIVDVGTPGTKGRAPLVINPDMLADFRCLPFMDAQFWHIVFDPPHLRNIGLTGKFGFCYGRLTNTWKEDLRNGFAECFRVLKPNATLIFKWCESEIPLKDVLSLTSEKPLYGHRSGKKAKTIWVAFIKRN